MPPREIDQIQQELLEQIGDYGTEDSQSFAERILSPEGKNELYAGVNDYKTKTRLKKIEKYLDKPNSEAEANDPKFFRKKFVEYMTKVIKEGKECDATDSVRKNNPDDAAIKMGDFLGEEGAALYRLALEEERYSEEFMAAVFERSTTHYEGEKWNERPVLFVAGPSGCGKSFAAQAAVKKSSGLLKTVETADGEEPPGNDVVAADGGIAREVSQMRKLVIQVANYKGYPGITDLHEMSKTLSSVKERVQEAVLKTESLGLVVPETFSDGDKELMKRVMELPKTKVIFCRVTGKDFLSFQNVVAFMGLRRAWKTTGFENKDELSNAINLNNTKICESKAYGGKGFIFGLVGSWLAEIWFKKHCSQDLRITITNDLVVKKPDPNQPHVWLDAKCDDKGAIKVSARVYEQWEATKTNGNISDPSFQGLEAYSNSQSPGTLIATTGELTLALARNELLKKIQETEKNWKNAEGHPDERMRLNWKKQLLRKIYDQTDPKLVQQTIEKRNSIDSIRTIVAKEIAAYKSSGYIDRFKSYFSSTKQTLDNVAFSLEKISKGLDGHNKLNTNLFFKEEYQKRKEAKHTHLPYDPGPSL